MTANPVALTVAPGLQRAVWTSILERDLDLMLVDLLHTSTAFRQWLLRTAVPELSGIDAAAGFLGAWHSVNTPNGESDLEAEWQHNDGTRLTLLIEDKLGAAFQPDQGRRYIERAAGYCASGRARQTRVVLMAPAGYAVRDRAGCAPFERHVSVEALLAWCESGEAGDRSVHIAAFVRQALQRSGVSARAASSVEGATAAARTNGKPHFPEFYAEIEAVMRSRSAPADGVESITSSTPGEWVYFAFPRSRGSGASLRWRLRDSWVELVLPLKKTSRQEVEDAMRGTSALPGAAIAARGVTEVVVWLPTPEVDAFAPAGPQRGEIKASLELADALARWYSMTLGRGQSETRGA